MDSKHKNAHKYRNKWPQKQKQNKRQVEDGITRVTQQERNCFHNRCSDGFIQHATQ